VCQAPLLPNVPTPSRAGSLPQVFAVLAKMRTQKKAMPPWDIAFSLPPANA